MCDAPLLGMAILTPALSRHCFQTTGPCPVTLIILQGPCSVQCSRSQIGRVVLYRVAGGVTDTTVDAFNGRIGLQTHGAARWNLRDLIVSSLGGVKLSRGLSPFIKKYRHVSRKVFDHGQIAEGLNGQCVT